MPRVRSIQMRVLLWGWGVLIAGLALAFWRYSSTLDQETARDFERDTQAKLATVQWLLERGGPFADPRDRQDFLHSLGGSMGMRISLIEGGRVVADTNVPFDEIGRLDDHSTRPEVLAALGGEVGQATRHSVTLDRDMIYMARKLAGQEGAPDAVLRLAAPVSLVRLHLQRMRWALLAAVVPLLVGSGVLLWLLSRTITSGIAQFTEAAQAIGDGDYRRKILFYPAAEFQPLAEAINRMAKKIKKNVKIIENQRGELWAMFEGMSEGVMVLDSAGLILHVNPALSSIFPRAHEFIGRAPLEATMSLDIQNIVDSVMAGHTSERVNRQIELKDRHCAEMTVVPFRDHKFRPRVILVFHDTSEQKRVERVLRDFVANASHQLRTPLTSIRGYAETLLDAPPAEDEKRREFLEIIHANAVHMAKVIGGMFALAKSERDGKRPSDLHASIPQALDHALKNASFAAGDKDIALDLAALPENLPAAAADPDGLLQIVESILDNAIKYSPEGTTVSVSAEADGGSVVLRFADQGPGISEENQARIFERFFRADGNGVDGAGSAGLGLAICRHIARNYGGEVTVQSPMDPQAGTGSVFTVRLPVA
ncbi:two-component system, OmpR family, phosphate regulon sensor histidine kinase PhoR [Humidesulfovibrio mexicanus]|uniref:histidine kinase n=1 Tax=Humidesulfovibrio mexicanus TaxID=147047 RepID=A0A239A9J9_9BACT|nr:ATP-binding protein [Humidesulfovibrio mexicanus]SNR92315.1 two-component system, OmpR family, phosphate regulon sensor histidine kinase PhoR [Humidesulfovibrio mexicanus]